MRKPLIPNIITYRSLTPDDRFYATASLITSVASVTRAEVAAANRSRHNQPPALGDRFRFNSDGSVTIMMRRSV